MSSFLESIETEGAIGPEQVALLHEQDLALSNLQQEATWLYEDYVKLSSKERYQDEILAEKNSYIEELRSELLKIKNENGSLKAKLQELHEREVTHHATLDECVRHKEEVCILQKRLSEEEQWHEQAESKERQIQDLKQRMLEQQTLYTYQQHSMNDLKNQIQGMQAMYEMESTRRKAAERQAKKLGDMLRVLTESEHTTNQNEDGRFTSQRLPDCQRCHTLLPSDSCCSYHDKAPINVLVKDSNSHVYRVGQQRFWPCCGKTAIKEPEGCRTSPFHEAL